MSFTDDDEVEDEDEDDEEDDDEELCDFGLTALMDSSLLE